MATNSNCSLLSRRLMITRLYVQNPNKHQNEPVPASRPVPGPCPYPTHPGKIRMGELVTGDSIIREMIIDWDDILTQSHRASVTFAVVALDLLAALVLLVALVLPLLVRLVALVLSLLVLLVALVLPPLLVRLVVLLPDVVSSDDFFC